jgi:transposase InsO family protein
MQIVEQVKQQLQVPYEAVCRELAVPYSSLMRWKRHRAAGEPAARRPGPANVGPHDQEALHGELLQLRHGRHRTAGTTSLHERYREQISRRDFQALVEAARREVREAEQARARRVEWLIPGLVWAMDDTEKPWLEQHAAYAHVVLDLGSRYLLRVLGDDELASGLRVALNLEALFAQYGPPLFLKLDGGGNYRHHEVRRQLAVHGVIPLLSPPHYPPYNGSVERVHQQLEQHVENRIGAEPLEARILRLECELSAHELNHKPRVSLGGRTACAALRYGRPVLTLFNRRKREEVFETIKSLAVDIAEELDEHTTASAETAFRYAAETWMQQNHMIRVTRNGEVLPPFYQIQSH